jgi:hypothetical protein
VGNGWAAVEPEQEVALPAEVCDEQLEEGVDNESLGLAPKTLMSYFIEIADGVDEERSVERVQRDEG